MYYLVRPDSEARIFESSSHGLNVISDVCRGAAHGHDSSSWTWHVMVSALVLSSVAEYDL